MRIPIPRQITPLDLKDVKPFIAESIAAFRVIGDNAFLQQDIVEVAVGVTPTRIIHKLGRLPKWVVVDKNADARVWRVSSTPTDDSRFFYLQASAAVTVKLLLF